MPEGPWAGRRQTLRRLSQVAAATSSHRIEGTIDWLLPMLAYASEKPRRSADDWFEEISSAYGIEVPLLDITESIARLRKQGTLVWDSFGNQFHLSKSAVTDIEAKIQSAEELEAEVLEVWRNCQPLELQGGLDEGLAWDLFMEYCARTFRKHGLDAIQVLTGDSTIQKEANQSRILDDIISSNHLGDEESALLAETINAFFTSSDPLVGKYVAHLADSTFNLMALCVDDDTKNDLRKGLPHLKIFVDTNILFALMGTHDTPLAAASLDLFRVIKEARLPFTLYYHSKTLAELNHSVEDAAYRLRRQQWSPQVSRAIIRMPWNATRFTGIEMRFHQLNAVHGIDPAAFCARYQQPSALLSDFGLKIYRDPDVAESSARLEFRSTVISDYKQYLEKHPRRKNTHYAKLDHDASVWIVAKDQQTPSPRGPLFSGSFFLSSDYVLWRFDREVMGKAYNSKPVVVLPDAFLMSLRPFVGGVQFNDHAFVQAFTSSEFRAGSRNDLAGTLRKVASYLATFEDLPEETAARLLADSILMEGLKKYDAEAPEFAHAIEKAIFAHNEALIQERDELLVEREEQLEVARRALQGVQEGGSLDEVKSHLEKLLTGLQAGALTRSGLVVNIGETVNTGGSYHNTNSQVGAQGPNAFVANNNQLLNSSDILNDPLLMQDLAELKRGLLAVAASAADYEAVAGIQGAMEALEKKDANGVAAFLKKAGQRALEVAVDLGAKVASSAIRAQLGLEG